MQLLQRPGLLRKYNLFSSNDTDLERISRSGSKNILHTVQHEIDGVYCHKCVSMGLKA